MRAIENKTNVKSFDLDQEQKPIYSEEFLSIYIFKTLMRWFISQQR